MPELSELIDLDLIKEVFSSTRLLILLELALGEKSLIKLAKKLNLSPSTIHYHITKLLKLGLIEVSKVERKGNIIVKYYRAVDEFPELSVKDRKTSKEVAKRIVLPCMIAFLTKILERVMKLKGISGSVGLLM